MNFQEFQNEPSVDSRLAMLHLSSAAAESNAGELSGDHHQQCHSCVSLKNTTQNFSPETSTTTAAAETTDLSLDKNTLYGGGANKAKRYSKCRFSSSLEEPFPKRTATLYGDATTTTTAAGKNNHRGLISTTATGDNNNNFQGFMKIPLLESPVTTPSPAKPPLPPPIYRTFSDPTGSSSIKSTSHPPHRTLTRTASWSPNGESPNTTLMKSPNHCALARTASWSPNVQELGDSVNNGESPTAKRLKRMKDGMREMRQWCDIMIQEEETSHEENKIVKGDETDSGGGGEEEALCEEAVWVERMGSCLILHFKCPCGKGYQILLCGNNCYYKLTNF